MLRPDSYRDPPLWVTPTGPQNSIWFRPYFRRYARTSSPDLKRRAGRLLGPFVTVSSKETSFNCRELTPGDRIKDAGIMTESVALEQQRNPTCANSAQAAGQPGQVHTCVRRSPARLHERTPDTSAVSADPTRLPPEMATLPACVHHRTHARMETRGACHVESCKWLQRPNGFQS